MGTTAYCYDDIFLEHETGWGHPERPERLTAINKKLKSMPYYKDLKMVGPSLPDMKYIEMIHSPYYIKRVKREIEEGIACLDSMDTPVSARSYEVALMAVGGSLNMCDYIMSGKADFGFCAVRPPGHHAEYDEAAGFCIFNNIAIAAKYLQSKHGIKKIGIVDWDVHHGNGTQNSFYSDKTVLYISTHQYPHYPGSGSAQETGNGTGRGFILNIPMNAGSDDEDYKFAFGNMIIPALEKFKPEIILISAGFDAHKSDQLSGIRLSTEMFGMCTKMLITAARKHDGGRIIAFLEGGYDLNALADSVEKMMAAFIEG